MLIWQGNLSVEWPAHSDTAIRIQLWCDTKLQLESLTLEFDTFVKPNLVPLVYIRGPVLTVYSDDEQTIQYFGELNASELGILAKAGGCESFDHFLFYFIKSNVCVRPLVLTPPQTSVFVADPDAQRQEPTPGDNVGPPKDLVVPRAKLQQLIQRITLGAMRMRGFERESPQFKTRYSLCYKSTEFSFRDAEPTLELVKERVETFLNLLG